MADVLRKKEIWTQIQRYSEMEDWNDASAGQGTPKTASKPPKAKKSQGKKSFLYRFQGEHDSADTVISDS